MYAAVLTAYFPHLAPRLFQYQHFLTLKSRAFQPAAWLHYDTDFRLKLAANGSWRFDAIATELWATCFAQRISQAHSYSKQLLIPHSKQCIQPAYQYFTDRLQGCLKEPLAAFKAACLFVPQKIRELQPNASTVNCLSAFPFLNNPYNTGSSKARATTILCPYRGPIFRVQCITLVEEQRGHPPNLGILCKNGCVYSTILSSC